jgi:hypothetical protein
MWAAPSSGSTPVRPQILRHQASACAWRLRCEDECVPWSSPVEPVMHAAGEGLTPQGGEFYMMDIGLKFTPTHGDML